MRKYKGIHMEMLLNARLCARLHSNAKLNKTSEFGTKKGLLQNMQGEWVSCPPNPQIPVRVLVNHF